MWNIATETATEQGMEHMEEKIQKQVPGLVKELQGGALHSYSALLTTIDGMKVVAQLASGGGVKFLSVDEPNLELVICPESNLRMLGEVRARTVEIRYMRKKKKRTFPAKMVFEQKAFIAAISLLLAKKRAQQQVTSRAGTGSRPGRRQMSRPMMSNSVRG